VPAAAVVGNIADAARRLAHGLPTSGWQAAEIAALKTHMRGRARVQGQGPAITPNRLVDAVLAALPPDARITVDAGAHMLPVMALFEARRPRDALISRGLATMAYALPAAIGAALEQPERPVVAFTGDGGLMMCAAELATAVQAGCKITVVVFNDSSIALIGVKQQQRQLRREGMDYSPTDFAQVARGFGCEGLRVTRADELDAAVATALAASRPVVLDVVVDHAPYPALVKSLRG
jgi:acetolactate synthase-1/2/3 large subunit